MQLIERWTQFAVPSAIIVLIAFAATLGKHGKGAQTVHMILFGVLGVLAAPIVIWVIVKIIQALLET